MKLHLGCGQRYLPGYVNVDLADPSHTVQEKSIADLLADIHELRYACDSIDEIRLHHVFEHFPRPVACALLSSWYSWLKQGGILHIEVPDFQKSAKVMLRPFSSFKQQAVAERHLFGSHEAHWAVHCEGYTPAILKKMIENYGYTVRKIKKNSWMGTYNFELFAEKTTKKTSKTEFANITEAFLKNYLLDEGESESRLLDVWMDIYNRQIDKCWATND